MDTFMGNSFDFLDKKTRKILLESRESFIPHTPYKYEKELLEAVRMGDIELAMECSRLLASSGKEGTLSQNPLRQAQIIFIALITQITRAAMDADVPEDLAYAMSDNYIQTSENCTKLSQIQILKDRALQDFTAAVKHQKTSPPFSKSVRKSINYMNSHMQEKITLDDLTRAAGLSQGRFSHLFHEETGMSPMAYLQAKKIKTAKNMLLYTEYTVSEISNILCFSNESHFIKVFKKSTGISPGKYRTSNH